MKRKLLCIAVAVIMILPLAFAAIPTVSAAGTLGSMWREISGEAEIGTNTVNADGSITMTTAGVAFGKAGVVSNKKLYVDGLKLELSMSAPVIAGDTHSQGAMIYLSKSNIEGVVTNATTQTVTNNPIYNIWYAASCDLLSTAVYLVAPAKANNGTAVVSGANNSLLANAGKISYVLYDEAATQVADYSNFTVEFKVNGDNVDLYVDGSKLEGYSLPKANFVDEDGYAYLAVYSNGYGSAQPTVTLKEINDTAANDFNEGIVPTPPFDPATSNWTAYAEASTSTITYDPLKIAGAGQAAALVYNNKVVVDGLEIGLIIKNNYLLENGVLPLALGATFNVNLSANKPDAIVPYDCDPAYNVMGGNKSALNCEVASTASATFLFDTADNFTNLVMFGGMNSKVPLTYAEPFDGTATSDVEFTVKFVYNLENDTLVDIYVNGEYATSFEKAAVVDENDTAYLSFCNSNFGGATIDATITTINGVDANVYAGETTTEPEILGAQYRTEGAAGLRFLTKLNLNEKNSNENIAKMGTLIMPADILNGEDLVLTDDGKINDIAYLDIAAKNYYTKTANILTFTAVLIGIPENQIDRDFVAVSYIVYEDGTVTYSDDCVRAVIDFVS